MRRLGHTSVYHRKCIANWVTLLCIYVYMDKHPIEMCSLLHFVSFKDFCQGMHCKILNQVVKLQSKCRHLLGWIVLDPRSSALIVLYFGLAFSTRQDRLTIFDPVGCQGWILFFTSCCTNFFIRTGLIHYRCIDGVF